MKRMIYVPLIFLFMLLSLIIYDAFDAYSLRKDMLLKQDRIRFSNIIVKAAHAHYPLKIDSFHYIIFVQRNTHDDRVKMFNDVESRISVYAESGKWTAR